MYQSEHVKVLLLRRVRYVRMGILYGLCWIVSRPCMCSYLFSNILFDIATGVMIEYGASKFERRTHARNNYEVRRLW